MSGRRDPLPEARKAARGRRLWHGLHVLGIAGFLVASVTAARADTQGLQAFADHCFSPFLTAQTAAMRLPARHDFYDLAPFRPGTPLSEPQGRPVTPGTDRRCEVTCPGTDVAAAVDAALSGLAAEGIATEAAVPTDFPAQPGTEFIAARQLNPNRIAVVQVGTRPGANGIETFLNVERLVPLND